MVRRIESDHRRFRQIVRGQIKQHLRQYISQGELIGRAGKDNIAIPLPQIELPHFTFSSGEEDGVGSGSGEEGSGAGEGAGMAGEDAGDHLVEVDVTLDELAQILGEELELPRILPRGQARRAGRPCSARAPSGRKASGTSSGPSRRRSSARSRAEPTTPTTLASSPSGTTAATVPGGSSTGPSPTRRSST